MLTYLASVAYFLMLCAFVTRDMLYLRSLLVVAQALLFLFGWRTNVPVIAAWNILFTSINLAMVVQILRERRAVALPIELRSLYDRHFSALSAPEFLRWWGQGRRESLEHEPLARAGQHPEWLYFLLNGSVRVSREGKAVLELPSGFFVAEMSLLTGAPANADVDAIDRIDVMRWSTRDLRDLRRRNPALWTRMQSVLGLDLVEKVRLGEARGAAAAAEHP